MRGRLRLPLEFELPIIINGDDIRETKVYKGFEIVIVGNGKGVSKAKLMLLTVYHDRGT